MIGIHPIHRKMALITWMSMNQDGKIKLDEVAIQMLKPLLKQNLMMIQRLDELKSLSFQAYLAGETEWHKDIRSRIEALEKDLFEV
ncbi:hypothetical protein HMSSN036_51720 [Paenibacillus macerans]|uniref:DUF7667 family protein n=1 Tax=Paenibacillus macerans TaxID=44252 RepID=UPI002080CBA4|nr:hypothetical protein [Paenibacillus macerans]MEC0140777.1 hypothetical protein [Paenibacillus macerans]GJM72956.1 hypothetical protein HMSSN036_51720 [Paenibacillus macerans]